MMVIAYNECYFTNLFSLHEDESGSKDKTVKIYKFTVDGVTICLILTDCYDLKGWGLEYGAEGRATKK